MVAIAFGVLVVSMAAAATLARETAADSAISDLKQQAPTVGRQLTELARRFRQVTRAGRDTSVVCRLIIGVLRISGGSVVVVQSDGTIEPDVGQLIGARCFNGSGLAALPRDVRISDLEPDSLLTGTVQTGVRENTAFVAQPLQALQGRVPVLIVAQHVETRPLGRAGPFLLGAGALALVAAALISAYLARRLTRPIAAMQSTARRIADGDLSARVDLGRHPDDELASLARSLDTMANQLETARGHERAFLLNVSHDLRTPLTSIRGYADAIADGTIDPSEQSVRAAEIIASEARRLDRLVADLLDLARLDTHQFSLSPRPIDAREVVYEVVAGFVPSAHEWGVRLEIAQGAPVPVDADPERLGQITANLVENALKYAGSVVRVNVAQQDGWVELRVDDDGPGVSPAEQQRVFERLYTARGAPGRKVGTGIGLAIVHELAVAMQGAARCESLDGGGTRFVVTIPS
jgi:signal transduction histidine kinase